MSLFRLVAQASNAPEEVISFFKVTECSQIRDNIFQLFKLQNEVNSLSSNLESIRSENEMLKDTMFEVAEKNIILKSNYDEIQNKLSLTDIRMEEVISS